MVTGIKLKHMKLTWLLNITFCYNVADISATLTYNFTIGYTYIQLWTQQTPDAEPMFF